MDRSRTRIQLATRATLLGALALALAGCSGAPTAPGADVRAPGAQYNRRPRVSTDTATAPVNSTSGNYQNPIV
jgi:hypothetical protein